jgi:hypothetical protein
MNLGRRDFSLFSVKLSISAESRSVNYPIWQVTRRLALIYAANSIFISLNFGTFYLKVENHLISELFIPSLEWHNSVVERFT